VCASQGKASALKELQARRAQKEKAEKKKKKQRAEEDGVEMSEEEEEVEEEEEARDSDEEAARRDAEEEQEQEEEKKDPVMNMDMLHKVRTQSCCSRTGGTSGDFDHTNSESGFKSSHPSRGYDGTAMSLLLAARV